MKLQMIIIMDDVKQVWFADYSSAVGPLKDVENGGNTYRPMDQTLGTAENPQRPSS